MIEWLIMLFGSPLAAKAAAWLLSVGVVALTTKVLHRHFGKGYLSDVLERLAIELKSAVLEVHQVYVAEISRGRVDGVLTAEEKAEAKRRAMDTLKSNMGVKGLKRLAKALGLDSVALDKWLGNKVEATVAELKAGPLA